MAFNPDKPEENTPLDAAEMRNQFNGLNDLITAMGSKCDGVVPLNIPFHDPPTRAEIQAVADKLNEMLSAQHS